MIECPVCKAKYPENTLFCDECGAYLPGDHQEETDPLVAGMVLWEESRDKVAGEDITSPLGLRLTVVSSGHEMEVPLTKDVNIGRLDPASGSFPEVDLSGEGALEKGISRRHARITRRGREVFVEDLGSLNGTFLNGKKLTPYLAHGLKNGDELQLGKVVLRVSFTK